MTHNISTTIMDLTKLRCWAQDPTCPCNDGDACHYEDLPTTKDFPASRAEPIPCWMRN